MEAGSYGGLSPPKYFKERTYIHTMYTAPRLGGGGGGSSGLSFLLFFEIGGGAAPTPLFSGLFYNIMANFCQDQIFD